jgi:hypothetical protein
VGVTALSIGNEILSTTINIHMKEYRDGLHFNLGFLKCLEDTHGKGQPTQEGGARIIQPVILDRHSNATALDSGYEEIDLTFRDASRPAVYDWAHVVHPIGISGEEEMINAGKAQVIKMLTLRGEAVANEAMRDLTKQIVQGSVTAYTNKWNTLNGVDLTTTGFLENAAVGSQSATVGGLSKATYAATRGWQNQRATASGAFNANGLNALYTIKTDILAASPLGPPDIILASKAGYVNLKRSLQAYERYVDEKSVDGGYMVGMWDGVKIEVEPQLPDAGTNTTANPISFMFLNSKDILILWDPSGFFEISDFVDVSGNFDVRAAKLRVRGQLMARLLGSSALVVNANAF